MWIRNACREERGSALLLSLLILTALTILGTVFMAKTKTETQIAGYDMRATQALFNAEAGYGEALARMKDPSDAVNYIGRSLDDWKTNPGWGVYVVASNGDSGEDPDLADTETDGLDNDLDGSVDESGERYPEIVSLQGEDAIDYPWVKVRYKRNATGQVIVYGDHDNDIVTPPVPNLVNGFPVIVVSAEGNQGTSLRRVEVEAIKIPFDAFPAAVYSEDDQFKFNGTAFLVSGQDHDPVTWSALAGNPEVPGIATTADPDNISGALAGNQENNVEGAGSEPSVTDATMDVDLEGIRDAFAPQADIVLPPATYSNEVWGGIDDFKIVYCPGTLHTSGANQGGGLLIIDGDFDCSGQFIWYGLIVVLGNMDFTGGGSGIHILGAVYVQGGVQQEVGGQADIFYSSETLANLAIFMPYVVSSWREL